MHPLVWFLIIYMALSAIGVWFQMNNMTDKLFPKIPKFIPFFGFDKEKKEYYPVIFRQGWLFRHKYFELRNAIASNPDEAVYNAKALISGFIVPLHEHPIPKYSSKHPPQ